MYRSSTLRTSLGLARKIYKLAVTWSLAHVRTSPRGAILRLSTAVGQSGWDPGPTPAPAPQRTRSPGAAGPVLAAVAAMLVSMRSPADYARIRRRRKCLPPPRRCEGRLFLLLLLCRRRPRVRLPSRRIRQEGADVGPQHPTRTASAAKRAGRRARSETDEREPREPSREHDAEHRSEAHAER